ncbi:IS3 family transposase [Enterococcus termitis]|uniref:IS3 family transposase n=1 Tax=Enterococcus termitis TaxID=332950 RepID=UPI0008FFF718|nr:IS3 family transposase [Enterococcus termitis]OJG99454.1 hypothetical protein RV18_GL001522 [Enterococcus termitis]
MILLEVTYAYSQRRFDCENTEKALEKNNIQIALNKRGVYVNQKKIRRIMHKLGLKGAKFTHKSRKNGEIFSYQISENPTAKAILDAQKEAIKVTSD